MGQAVKRAEIRKASGELQKKCTKCGRWRVADNDNYGPLKEGKLGLHPWCRACHREYRRQLDKDKPSIRKSGYQVELDDTPRQQKRLSKDVLGFISSFPEEIEAQSRFKCYLISNVATSEAYVGITERKLKNRWRQHIVESMTGKGYLLHDAIRHYGLSNFQFTHIASAKSRAELHELERLLIAQYETVKYGYNQTRGGGTGESVGKFVSVQNKDFISINSAARYFGVEEYSVHQRINKYGWSLEEALGVKPRQRPSYRGHNYSIKGGLYSSFRAACQNFNLDESVVRSRLKLGWTKEQAFELKPAPKRGRNVGTPIIISGKRYKSKGEAARHFGIKESVFTSRLLRGWTLEQAAGLNLPPKAPVKAGKVIAIGDSEYPSEAAFARAFGKDYTVVRSRLSYGWTPEQAVDLKPPPAPSGEKNGSSIVVGGTMYLSRAKAARAHGLDPRKVHKRIKAGWSMDEAFGLKSRAN